MIRRLWLAIVVMLAPSLSASAAEAPKADRLSAIWSVKVSDPAGARTLLPVGKGVVAVTWEGDIVMLAGANGKRRWRKKPRHRGGVDRVSIAVDGNVVAAAWPGEPRAVGYRSDTGKEVWSTALSAVPNGLVGCERHRVMIVTHRGLGTLLATGIDPKSGAILWQAPAGGPVVGAGDGYAFTAAPSGFGVWPGTLEAIDCATGERQVLGSAGRQLVRFMTAGGGVAVARHLDPGFAREQICLHPLGRAEEPRCLATTDGAVPAHPATGALVKDGVLYFSSAHITAHNLDPSPDSWVFAQGLDGNARWRSPPLVSRGPPVDAGALLLTGFGTTGIDDFAYLIDPADGQPVGRLPLRKAPNVLAADAERGYVATYDGRVYAIRLPRPGPEPKVRVPVAASDKHPQSAAVETGPWRMVAHFDAHPRSARTSGSRREGSASAVDFVDAEGLQVAVGGNDDRVRVMRVADGERLWISKGLGKDVQHLQVGGGRIHARVYGGRSFTFSRGGRRWRRSNRIDHQHGWMSGITGDGARVLTDDFSGILSAFDAKSGDRLWQARGPTTFDQRGVQVVGNRVVLHQDEQMVAFDVSGSGLKAVASRPIPAVVEGSKLTQAWMVDGTRAAWEYCGRDACVVEFADLSSSDGPRRRVRFDTRGAGWMTDVPSTLAVSPDGRWLFFFRLGLEPIVVDVEADRRIPLSTITEKAASEYTTARFSADSRRLVVGMHPRPWQVTVIEQGGVPTR